MNDECECVCHPCNEIPTAKHCGLYPCSEKPHVWPPAHMRGSSVEPLQDDLEQYIAEESARDPEFASALAREERRQSALEAAVDSAGAPPPVAVETWLPGNASKSET